MLLAGVTLLFGQGAGSRISGVMGSSGSAAPKTSGGAQADTLKRILAEQQDPMVYAIAEVGVWV